MSEIETTRHIRATPEACWDLLGRRFGEIAQWASAIRTSSVSAEPAVGTRRSCEVGGLGGMGPMVLDEELVQFDADAMELTYVVRGGQPGFMKHAENHWTVTRRADGTATVRSVATVRVAWYMAPMAPLIRRQLRKDVASVLEEFAHQVEKGEVHPRKQQRTPRPSCLNEGGCHPPRPNRAPSADSCVSGGAGAVCLSCSWR